MLERAEQEQWSVRVLRNHVVERRRSTGERRGRPRSGAEHQRVRQLKHATRVLAQTAAQLAALALLGTDARSTIGAVARELTAIRERLEALARAAP